MKARVKATGELIDLPRLTRVYSYEEDESMFFLKDLEILDNIQPDYWIRLEHQYAGMAMQGMLNNSLLTTGLLKAGKSHEDFVDEVTRTALRYAHALVEMMKEERK
jgi:hypothetical protein